MNNFPIGQAFKERYYTLDLFRGAAAIAVLLYHIGYMLGDYALPMVRGYLAVDFFFVLSGFVISANYHKKIVPKLTFVDFIIARIARLWPLFLLTTSAGAVVVVAKLSRDYGYFDWLAIIPSLGLNLLMLPSFSSPYEVDRIFIFNGASWSVFFELMVNIFFYYLFRHMTTRQVTLFAFAAAALLWYAAMLNNGLDGGWSSQNFYVGAVRVLFGFVIGVLLFHLEREIKIRLTGFFALPLVVFLCSVFFVSGEWWVDWVLIVFVFPPLVLFASRCVLSGLYKRIAGILGDISFSVYLWQTPLMLLGAGLVQKILSQKIADFAPLPGYFYLTAMLLFSYLSWRFYELPCKKFFRARLYSLLQHKNEANGAANER